MFQEIGSPKLPFQNQNPEKSFASPVDDALNQRQERQAMTTFKATTEGTDKLGLRAVLERYANDQVWSTKSVQKYGGRRCDFHAGNQRKQPDKKSEITPTLVEMRTDPDSSLRSD